MPGQFHAEDCAMIDGQGICTCGLQPTLFDDLVPAKHMARTTDPETSHAAARMKRGSQRWRMLSAFDGIPHPACWDEAAAIAGITAQSSPWSRCTDLHRAGFLSVEGIGRTKTGAKAQAYQITKAGWEALHGA